MLVCADKRASSPAAEAHATDVSAGCALLQGFRIAGVLIRHSTAHQFQTDVGLLSGTNRAEAVHTTSSDQTRRAMCPLAGPEGNR